MTDPNVACIGSTPAPPRPSRATAPTPMPALASATGGRSAVLPAASTKNAPRPNAAPSAQATPATFSVACPNTPSTRARPASAAAEPASVSRCGRWPCRAHIQPTTPTMPRYSISSATPTGSSLMAWK